MALPENPQVSVIIPTYNRPDFMIEAIESVLAQTFLAVEVVVVNDGSTDNTADVLAGYGDRITAITQANAGTAAARNAGILGSHGKYIAFLDHDDLWLPSKLEIQMPVFDRYPEAGIVYCGRQFFNHYTGAVSSVHPAEPETGIHEFLALKAIALQSAVIPRAVFDEVGLFDTSISGADDWEMCIRISRNYRVIGIPDILVNIRGHEHQQTMESATMSNSILMVFERYKSVHGECELCRSAIAAGRAQMREALYQRNLALAKSSLRARHFLTGGRMLLQAVTANPSSLLRIPRRITERAFGKPHPRADGG